MHVRANMKESSPSFSFCSSLDQDFEGPNGGPFSFGGRVGAIMYEVNVNMPTPPLTQSQMPQQILVFGVMLPPSPPFTHVSAVINVR